MAIWTSPDVAYVGLTEPEARQRFAAPGMVGSAVGRYAETTKYAVDPHEGFVKLLFLRDGGRILGVYIYGHDANEIIHFGASLVNTDGTVFSVVKEVLAGVTFMEAYRFAALRGCVVVAAHARRWARL